MIHARTLLLIVSNNVLIGLLGISTPPVQAEGPPVVGVLVPLSGQFAELGKQCQWGVEVARRGLGKSGPVPEFVYEDSQADPKIAVSAFRRLVDAKKTAAVITIRSPIGLAINPLSAQAHVLLLGSVRHPRFVTGNPYAFQMWPQTAAEGGLIGEAMLKYGGALLNPSVV